MYLPLGSVFVDLYYQFEPNFLVICSVQYFVVNSGTLCFKFVTCLKQRTTYFPKVQFVERAACTKVVWKYVAYYFGHWSIIEKYAS